MFLFLFSFHLIIGGQISWTAKHLYSFCQYLLLYSTFKILLCSITVALFPACHLLVLPSFDWILE